ncbi:MAG: hypothetical protein DMD72_12390 [Gemmatimonadetes bacterium]|nr:MAG: hypothetical protein DMD72_12390 [Gemmatimonadota bacterium]
MDAILRARMRGSRLPGKVMLPVLGRPLLSLNIERIRRARTVDRLIVATGEAPEDDAIAALCRDEGVAVFRGSEADVLDRIYQCASRFELAAFAKFCADNPLIDPAVIDQVIGAWLAQPEAYDYLSNNHPPTWQDGQELEVIRTTALEHAWREARLAFQREHVTPFLWDQPQRFRVGNVARADDRWYHEYRWTLDYPEDYEFIRQVCEILYPRKPDFGTEDLMALLREYPEIHRLNASRAGYVWYRAHLDALQTVKGTGHLKE